MTEAYIKALLNTTKEIMQEQIKDDLDNLKNSLDTVLMYLYDAEMQPVTNRAVKHWLRKLEDVAFEADNVLDEINYEMQSNNNVDKINYQILSKKVDDITHGQSIKTITKRVASFLSLSRTSIKLPWPRLAVRIRDIVTKLAYINKEAKNFDLQTRIAVPQIAPISPETDSVSADPIIIGRENDVSRIVNQILIMTTSPSERQVLSVLPIVGMGGIGKTELARKVFGDQRIKSHFEHIRVWVHVPRIFDVFFLLKNILTSLTGENVVEHGNREALLKKLQKHLGAQRYLLVLDDVWNEEREIWDSFVNSLAGISSAMGNCIIVTTRSHEVASIVERTLAIHELQSLSQDKCWSIIKAKAFNNSRNVPIEFEEMGRNIAERCQGLPLAAKVVGGLLCGKSKDEWLLIEKNWLSNFRDENTISKILKLSFDNLSPPLLKKCFAYCSIFQKGYNIGKEQLIELWMAEGFLQTNQRSNMETMGNRLCNLLLQNSLLQVAKRDNYGNVTHCYMHDLVHDLACSVLCEDDNVMDEICRSRYFGYRSSGSIESCTIPEVQKSVRTLFFNVNISEDTFSNFKSLHTLTLVGRDIENLPTSIRELIHLRYLDISYTTITSFPDSVGELYYLQTIRARREEGSGYLKNLPDSLKYLINLRHLHISNNTKLPPDIGRLTSLQTLPYFRVSDEKGRGIGELGKLKNVKGELEIHNLEKVRDKNEAMSANLLGKTNINKLKLVWDANGEANDMIVLEGLQPHPNLKSLEICGFKGKSLPVWISKMAVQDGCWEGLLNNLMEIKLTDCSECEELPMLGHLPYLKYLCLSNMKNVRSIGSSFYNIDKCNSNRQRDSKIVVFGALERLELSNMPMLREWVEVELSLCEVVVFPCLEYLIVHRCSLLMRAPSHFTSLRHLDIIYCQGLIDLPIEMVESCAQSLESLTLIGLNSIGNLGMVIEACLHKMPRLLGLVIEEVPKFSINLEIDSLRSRRNSLQYLQIGPFSSYSLSWNNVSFNKTVDAILQASQSTLRDLLLFGVEDWDCIPDQLQHLNALSILSLGKLGIEALPDWFVNLSSLEKLNLCNCNKLRNLPSKEAMQCLKKLTELRISNCRQLLFKKETCNNSDQWPNISHISNIKVDGTWISSGHCK